MARFAPILALSFLVHAARSDPIASICSVQWSPSTSFDIFDTLIRKSDYNKDIRPTSPAGSDNPTEVRVNFFVSHVESMDELTGKFTALYYFRQQWVDPRLSYETSTQFQNQCSGNKPLKLNLPPSMVDEIYQPDLFITQELESRRHGLLHPDSYVRVYPNGTVLLSRRVSITLACPQLAKMDTATAASTTKECGLHVESYAHTDKEMIIDWIEEENPVFHLQDVFVPKRWKLEEVQPLRCDVTTGKGTYSCIKGKFIFSKGARN